MGRNVEIKARVYRPQRLRERALARAETVDELDQEDLFFNVPKGRLKLRSVNGRGELIYYERPNRRGPKLSRYRVVPVREVKALGDLLEESLGLKAVVSKHRTVAMVGQTRVHLDHVDNLGDFMELEVVLEDHQTEEDGNKVARELMKDLEIDEADLLDCAYVDLLEP